MFSSVQNFNNRNTSLRSMSSCVWNKKMFWALLLFLSGEAFCGVPKVQMRVVHDTANYGYFGNSAADAEAQPVLEARVKSANFSGPSLLRKLIGHCYDISIDRYQYTFCPFANITQHEISFRWNAYHGVLGIWSHWKIENNTFVSMLYTLGDECGSVDRTVEVFLVCGEGNFIENVTEPSRCQYALKFVTKLVCHDDAMLVYPRLNSTLQKQWDMLWTDYNQGYITEKGYNKSLHQLLLDAGLVKPLEFPVQEPVSLTTASTNTFTDLNVCNREYEALKKEVIQLSEENDSLKVMLDLNKILNRTRKEPRR